VQVVNLTRGSVIGNYIEVADSSKKRRKGLLGRQGLLHGEGLWIVPCESVHTIGMQFAIDLIYLDRKYQVRKIRNSVPAWRFSICFLAHTVLEVPIGTVTSTHTKVGDTLQITVVARRETQCE